MPHARSRPSVLAAVLVCAACVALPARAAEADADLLAAARAAEPAVVRTLREMVAIESGSGDAEGLARMADYAERRLREIGARTERPAPVRGQAPLVKGSFEGGGTRRVLLIAHMDTVYPRGTLAAQPLRQEGNRLYGPGIADDKGGIAVILHSLDILLKQRGWRDFGRLTVLLNADEEVGSTGSGELIAAEADRHDVVLSFEPTAAKAVARTEALLLGTSGTATATLEVEGRAAHAGAAPQLGRNALVELAYRILQTHDAAAGVAGTQLNWTVARTGEVRNQIPDRAVATADVRLAAQDGAERLRAALERRLAAGALVPDTTTTLKLEVGRPPFAAGEKGRALAERAQAIYAELDGRPLGLVPMTGGATDAAFAARSGRATVVESFGLAGFGYHASDEYVELDSIVPRLYLATRLLQSL